MNNKTLSLLAAAAAAYGIFKLSKMSPQQKDELLAKGKDLLNKGLGTVKENMNKTKTQTVGENGF